MSPDEQWLDRALTLAEASIGLASPNPQVGCILVHQNKPIGQGAHLYNALDHAEIVALKQAAAAGVSPAGATAYVTLEPCNHHGRTGPCADALIAAGIARCVVATLDPNPAVSGRGIEKMRAAGIAVEVGPPEAEARARTINNAFARSITSGRPYITLKAALSVDGMLAPPAAARIPNQPFWLSGPEARTEVQQLRHRSDAILSGIGTVLADDPLLTDRTGLPRRRPLMRIVLDTDLRIPLTSQLVQTAHDDLWLFCGPWALPEKVHPLQALGIRVTTVPFSKVSPTALSLPRILEHIHKAKLLSVLLEAGSTLNGVLLQQHLVDQAILFYADTELGPNALPFATGIASPFALEQSFLRVNKNPIGSDICVTGILADPWKIAPWQTLPTLS